MVIAALLILLALFIAFATVFVVDFLKRRKSEKKFHFRESAAAYLLLIP